MDTSPSPQITGAGDIKIATAGKTIEQTPLTIIAVSWEGYITCLFPDQLTRHMIK